MAIIERVRAWFRARRRKMVMAGVMALILAVLAELGARVVLYSRGIDLKKYVLSPQANGMFVKGRYVSHPFLPFTLRSNSQHRIVWTPPPMEEFGGDREDQVWEINHNRWGFRGKDVTMPKPPHTLRVVCLGGSTTYDTITDGKTWTEKLEARLAEVHPDKTIEVLNFGMNSGSLPFQIVQLALKGVHFEPDLVILYPGHNDLWSGIGDEGFLPDYSHRLGHWDDSRMPAQLILPRWVMKSAFAGGLVVAVDRWRGIRYDLILQIMRDAPRAEDPLEGVWAFQRGLVTIQGIAQVHGSKLMVITPFYAFRRFESRLALADRIRETATEANIPLLDAAALMPAGDTSLVHDDVHFTDKGGTLFCSLVFDAIQEKGLLESR